MLVIFHPDATPEQIDALTARILETGAGAQRVVGEEVTVIGVIDGDRDHLTSLELDADPGVDRVVPVSSPYKLAHRHRHGDVAHPVDIAGLFLAHPIAAHEQRASQRPPVLSDRRGIFSVR